MKTLDERILIPASPQLVWDVISDFTRNPLWQVDCKSVAFLTTFHQGRGVRWRSSSDGREVVLEVTAWYDRLGYEYIFVDGVPYKENRGRVRLQEIAEGTIVQWTFSYEVGGLFGGFIGGRGLQNTMVDSLKKLYVYMKASAGGTFKDARTLMRDAPDADARAQYRPRHANPMDTVSAAPLIPEPPIADDDTRPRPPVQPPAPTPEPDFLADLPPTVLESSKKDTQEAKVTPPEAAAVSSAEPAALTQESVSAPMPSEDERPSKEMPAVKLPTPSAPTVESAAVRVPEAGEAPVSTSAPQVIAKVPSGEATASLPQVPAVPSPVPTEPPAAAEVPAASNAPTVAAMPPVSADAASKMDTSQISVFEVFGLKPPSASQEMRAVQAAASDDGGEPRRGWRVLRRRRAVRLRRFS